jgi:hypothetical protein
MQLAGQNCPNFAFIPKINVVKRSGESKVSARCLLLTAAATYFPALSINSAISAVQPVW